MGLFNFIKGQLIEVIEWVDESRDTIIHKFPDEGRDIKMGAQLTVTDSQVALFLNEGKMADTYQPGHYELTTRNMPLMTALRSWKMGFESPFKADVYFVNTRQFSNMKWGTPQPVMVSDPEFSLVQLKAFGSYTFQVVDAAKFFKEYSGTQSTVTTEEFQDHFRGLINAKFAGALKKAGKTLQEINANATELGDALLPIFAPEFENIGLKLLLFNVESVSLPEEVQKQLTEQDMEIRKTRRGGAAQNEVDMQRLMQQNMLELQKLKAQAEMSQSVGDMQKFLQFQAGLGMQHGGTSGTPSMMQNMMEMGMGVNMAKDMMGSMQGNTQAAATQGATTQASTDAHMSRDEVMKTLKELGELKAAGVLTEEEFNEKKKQLLSQL